MLNKEEFCKRMVERVGKKLSLSDAKKIYSLTFDTLAEVLKNFEEVSVHGVGMFYPKARRSKRKYNFQTQKVDEEKEMFFIHFEPSTRIKQRDRSKLPDNYIPFNLRRLDNEVKKGLKRKAYSHDGTRLIYKKKEDREK